MSRPAGLPATAHRPVPARVVAGLVVAGLAAVPWLVDEYTTALLARTLVLGLLAASVALLTGVAGLPTLGQTAPYAAGAYAAAMIGMHGQPVGLLQLLAAAAAGAGFAAVTSPLVIYARGAVVLMVTLAIGELAVITAGRWKSVTGGTDGLVGIPAGPAAWGLPTIETDRGRYLYVLCIVTVTLAGVLLALRSPAGLLLRAARDDEARARASGHPVTRYLAVAHIAAGTVAGIAGSLLVTTQQYLSPADFGFDNSALLLLAVVLGGSASILGAVAGAAVVFGARDWLSGLLPGQVALLLGAVFIATAYLLPRGIAGLAPPRILTGRRAP